jgi:endonuclease-8
MEGRVIEDARLRDHQFECERIIGSTVAGIEARGKHLLMHLSANSAIHSHMGMTGSWHVYHPGQAWLKPTHYAALVLTINKLEVICFSPRLLELLTADQLRRHPHLQQLGPDLLANEFDMPAAIARFRQRDALPLGEAVMNQRLVCGIGNIYKSEVLFLMTFDPFAPVSQFSDDELTRMLTKARYLLRRNSGGPNRTTRFGSDAGRMWVYGKSGRPCPKCGAVIQLRRQGEAGRTTCWCPECQPAR